MAAPDVFISYAREDRASAQALAAALQGLGLDVWWDREIPVGRDFAEVIAEQLDAARVVCVLWSASAVVSGFVRDESARARDAGKLLPVRIEAVNPPLGFGTLQTLDLLDWPGDADDEACATVVREIETAVHARAAGTSAADATPPRRAVAAPPKVSRRARLAIAVAASLGLAGLLAWGGWQVHQSGEARAHLAEGLKAQFARDPNLEAARTEYLFALEADPDLAPAHYYLGHVYARLDERDAAREQFVIAIRIGDGLDGDQRRAAEALLQTLDGGSEPTAINRATASETDKQLPSSTAPAPAPAPTPAPARPPAQAGAGPSASLPGRVTTASPSPAVRPGVDVTGLEDLSRRVPAPAALARDVAARVDALFNADAQTRLNATTALALTPADNSEALPLAIERALAGLARAPDDAAVRNGVNATLALLQTASAMSLAFHRDEIERLLSRAAGLSAPLSAAAGKVRARLADAGRRAPVVFIQIAAEAQRPLARMLASRFIEAGYDVPGIELVGTARAPSRGEIRAQGTSNLGLGRWQRKQMIELAGEPVALVTLRKAEPALDTYEIWLDKAVCVAPDRRMPGCGP